MDNNLLRKERQAIGLAIAASAFIVGAAAEGTHPENLETVRLWIVAIAPAVGAVFALVALYRAGRSLDFTSKQFLISQSALLEQRAARKLKISADFRSYHERTNSTLVKIQTALADYNLGLINNSLAKGSTSDDFLPMSTVPLFESMLKDTDDILNRSDDYFIHTSLSEAIPMIEAVKEPLRSTVFAKRSPLDKESLSKYWDQFELNKKILQNYMDTAKTLIAKDTAYSIDQVTSSVRALSAEKGEA